MPAACLTIFDCDGVLVDSEPLAAKAYVLVYGRHGMAIEASLIGRCVGLKQADIIARIEEETGHRLAEDHQGELWQTLKGLFSQALAPTPGLQAFLGRHDSRPEATRAVASSSHLERIHHSLGVTGLLEGFGDQIFSSSMVARGKPAPDLFLLAAERCGAAPHACTVFEDSPFGIIGAKAAGMRAIGYIGASHVGPEHADVLLKAGADAVIASWEEADGLF
ncbi:MAG: HAD family phosphatase [Hyphomicrobiaceae bacterium]|nr:HAD family phosphatase [Hyphomicrobiaceae bacterium]